MENKQSIVLGWPALMTQETASQYLSLDSHTFETVASRYSVTPVVLDIDDFRWRKTDLDKLIKRLPDDASFSSRGSKVNVIRLEKEALEMLAEMVSGKLNSVKPRNTSQLVSIRETIQLMGVGRSTVYRLIESGELAKLKIGRRTLIERDSINRLLSQ